MFFRRRRELPWCRKDVVSKALVSTARDSLIRLDRRSAKAKKTPREIEAARFLLAWSRGGGPFRELEELFWVDSLAAYCCCSNGEYLPLACEQRFSRNVERSITGRNSLKYLFCD